MIYRMYLRYCERNNFSVEVINEYKADHGLKSAEIKISGEFAFGYLSGEKGNHRLVRISPFNALSKRQTSFAAVEVWPVIEEQDLSSFAIPEKVTFYNSKFFLFQFLLLTIFLF